MENKVEGNDYWHKRGKSESSTQIEDRLEQYGFSKVAMIMYLITLLLGKRQSAFNQSCFFPEQKYQLC